MVFQISSNKCFICRKWSDLTMKKTAGVFIAWKRECATAICNVVFGKNIDYIVSYLQKANYCSGCEQLVRDVSYAWKQIQLFEHRISDLSTKMCSLINLNYEMMEEKSHSQPEITQERISVILDTTASVKIPDYSYEEMVEIIYSVLSSSLKPGLKKSFGCSNSSPRNHVEACPDPLQLTERFNVIVKWISNQFYELLGVPDDVVVAIRGNLNFIPPVPQSDKKESLPRKGNTRPVTRQAREVPSSSLKPGLKKALDCFNPPLQNHVEACPDPPFRSNYSSSQYFDIVDKIKEDLSDTEPYIHPEEAVEDPLFIENTDNYSHIKPENFNSDFNECNESDEGSGFENSEDISVEKYTSNDSNPSSEYEVTKQKRKRGRPPLKQSDKLKTSKKKHTPTWYYCEEEGCGIKFAKQENKQIHILKVHKGESKPFKCPQVPCEVKFTSLSHLKRHMKLVHEEGKVKSNNCTFCGTKYAEPDDLLSHYSTSHQEPNPFLCAFCPELFHNTLDLTTHTKQCHHQSNVCEICVKVFINASLLNSHVLQYHTGNDLCSVCGKTFKNKVALRAHTRTHDEPKSYKCDVCQDEFKYSSQLTSHMDLHNVGEFACKVCENILPNLYDLKVHESTHNPKQTEERESRKPVSKKLNYNFHCKFCSQGYFKEEELNQHYAVSHLGPNPFTCAFCPNIYSNSFDLTNHMKSVHPDPNSLVEKLKCDSCDRYFSSSASLCYHKRMIHRGPSLLIKCHLCSAVFKRKSSLKDHMDTHTQVLKYVCSKCGQAFKSYHLLYRHRRVHDDKQRKFACKICGKKFYTTLNCKDHESSHTNMKEFVCHICGKGFNKNENLTLHLKIHTGVPTPRR